MSVIFAFDSMTQPRVNKAELEAVHAELAAVEVRKTSSTASEDSALAVLRVVLSEVREQLSEAVKESALHNGTSANLRVEIATLTRKLAESIRDKGASQTKANVADAQLTKLHGAEKDMRIFIGLTRQGAH